MKDLLVLAYVKPEFILHNDVRIHRLTKVVINELSMLITYDS